MFSCIVCGLQPAVHFSIRLQRPSSHLLDFQWVTLNCNMLANSFKSVVSFRRALKMGLDYGRLTGNPIPSTNRQVKFFSTNLNDQVNSEGNKGESLSGESPTQEASPNEQQLNQLVEENKKLLDSVKDLDDKYKRALAEAENTRIRMRKQLEDGKIYAIQSFCKDLLEVADVFGTAIESVPKDSLKSSKDFKNLFDGVVMTEQQIQSVFRRHGLIPVNPIGEKFNPNEHHALFQVEAEDKEPGTVSVVTKIGYKLHERTIRPAMVGVVKSK